MVIGEQLLEEQLAVIVVGAQVELDREMIDDEAPEEQDDA